MRVARPRFSISILFNIFNHVECRSMYMVPFVIGGGGGNGCGSYLGGEPGW